MNVKKIAKTAVAQRNKVKVFREIAQMQQKSEAVSIHIECKKHPLLDKKILDDETIAQFEKLFTKDELMAWAKIRYYEYMFRRGKKDELKKMETFENYYYYLKRIRNENNQI